MTEDEAKTKWCPFARTLQGYVRLPIAANRTPNGDFAASHCIGSACAAWRWNPTADQVKAIREAHETHMEEAKRLARVEQRPAVSGYCGLAGRPQ